MKIECIADELEFLLTELHDLIEPYRRGNNEQSEALCEEKEFRIQKISND